MKNNKWTRAIALVMATVMTVGMLTGCGGNSSESTSTGTTGDVVTLSLACWDEQQGEVMKTIGAAYTEANPGVEINVQVTTWTEYWTKLEASASNQDMPDVFWVNVLHAEEYAMNGIMKDLTAVGEEIEIEANYPQALIDGYTYSDKLWAIPKDFDTNGIFYNTKIFDEAGVEYPTSGMTFEEYEAKCKELQDAGLPEGTYPTAVAYNSGQTTYYSSIAASGGYILSEDKLESGWNLPETLAGVEPWLGLVEKGYSPTSQQLADTSSDAMFSAGKVAMVLAGNYMIAEYAESLGLENFAVCDRPSFEGQDIDIMNGLGYAVSEFTEYEEEAMAFVTYLGGYEAMTLQAEGKKVIPARIDTQEKYLEAYPELDLGVFLNNLDQAKLFDFNSIWSELQTIQNNEIALVWEGSQTLEEAGEAIVEQQQPLLDKLK